MTIRILCAAVLIVSAPGVARAQAPGAAPPPGAAQVPGAAPPPGAAPAPDAAQAPGATPEPPPPELTRWEDHPLGVELALGAGAPTGLGGLMVDWTPVRWISLEGGGGIDRSVNLYDPKGATLQAAAMVRGRLAAGAWGLSAGLGLSTGSYQECDGCPFEAGDIRIWSHAVWRNLELAIEHRWVSGVGLQVRFGEARMLNPGSVSCEPHVLDSGCFPRSSVWNPYLGIGLHIPLMTSARSRGTAAPLAGDQRSPPNARL